MKTKTKIKMKIRNVTWDMSLGVLRDYWYVTSDQGR